MRGNTVVIVAVKYKEAWYGGLTHRRGGWRNGNNKNIILKNENIEIKHNYGDVANTEVKSRSAKREMSSISAFLHEENKYDETPIIRK